MKLIYKKFLFFFFQIPTFLVNAQCAMCKATAQQGMENGEATTHWLNYGILMLMAIPLALIAAIYWMYKKNNPNE